MLEALLVFWLNYAKIMLVFPNYATFLCSLKNMANKSKNTFSLIRRPLFLLALIKRSSCKRHKKSSYL